MIELVIGTCLRWQLSQGVCQDQNITLDCASVSNPKPFKLQVDASDQGVSAALLLQESSQKVDHPNTV